MKKGGASLMMVCSSFFSVFVSATEVAAPIYMLSFLISKYACGWRQAGHVWGAVRATWR